MEDKRPKLLQALKEVNVLLSFSFRSSFSAGFIIPGVLPPHTANGRPGGGLTSTPFMKKISSFAARRLLLGASLGLPKLG